MDWGEVELGTLVNRKIGYGIVQPGENVSSGIPVIKVNNIISGLNSIQDLDKAKPEIANKYQRTTLKGGELVISLVGSVGKTAIVPKSFAGCNLVRATGLIDIEDPLITQWVKYYIDSNKGQGYINNNLNTTVQATLNIKLLSEMPIPIPDRKIIEKTVTILSSLDAKIENNNKVNANLEAQAAALFKSWFVDFEPFRDGEFVESELGMIPKGWKVECLSDIARIRKGSINPAANPEKLYAHYSLPAFDAGKFPQFQFGNEIKSNKFVFADGSTLLSKLNPDIKRVWFVPTLERNAICSTEFIPIHSHLSRDYAYIYCCICNEYYYAKLLSGVSGATNSHQRLKPDDVLKLQIPTNDFYMAKFAEIVTPMLSQIYSNIVENQRLASIRDTLLPKLMSGEIDLDNIKL